MERRARGSNSVAKTDGKWPTSGFPSIQAAASQRADFVEDRCGSWLCKNDFGRPSSARLIQTQSNPRTKDLRDARAGIYYCVAGAVFDVFTQPGSRAAVTMPAGPRTVCPQLRSRHCGAANWRRVPIRDIVERLVSGPYRNHCVEIVSSEESAVFAGLQVSVDKGLNFLKSCYARLRQKDRIRL